VPQQQIADIANVESPESSYRGTLQQQLQAVTPVRVTQLMGENRQSLSIVAN